MVTVDITYIVMELNTTHKVTVMVAVAEVLPVHSEFYYVAGSSSPSSPQWLTQGIVLAFGTNDYTDLEVLVVVHSLTCVAQDCFL